MDRHGLVKAIYFNPTDEIPYNGAQADPDDPTKCVIYGHGTPGSVQDDRGSSRVWFGNNPDGLASLKEDLKKHGCTENMPVVFKSCSTGQGENSIAENFSPVWGNQTSAPDALIWWRWDQSFFGNKKYSLNPTPYAADSSGKHPDTSRPGSYRYFGRE
ncbi:hypothetical protein [Pseudomonas sp.]|uniref:hypothetical protein n=1 Tax=Pseudomonas sp. TaxID=306 RepID=UPI003C759C0F